MGNRIAASGFATVTFWWSLFFIWCTSATEHENLDWGGWDDGGLWQTAGLNVTKNSATAWRALRADDRFKRCASADLHRNQHG